MPTMWDEVEAVCPFYHRSKQDRIVCDGISEHSEIAVMCDSKKERDRLKGIYCDKYFKLCPIHAMLESEYERKVQSGEDDG